MEFGNENEKKQLMQLFSTRLETNTEKIETVKRYF